MTKTGSAETGGEPSPWVMAPDGTEPLRRTIYRHFAAHGTAPDESQLAAHLGWPVAQVVGVCSSSPVTGTWSSTTVAPS